MTRTISRLLISAALLVASGCISLNTKEADHFERAQEAFANDHWQIALDNASAVLTSRPHYVPARVLKGKSQFQLRRFDDSLETMLRLIDDVDPDDDPEAAFAAYFFAGRCQVEKGRAILPDSKLSDLAFSSDKRRASRDSFIAGNMHFRRSLEIAESDYDALLWRGYCVFRLENFRKAVEVFNLCETRAPERWEHKFFLGLALEGTYKTNAQSLAAYMEIVATTPRQEFAPVYEHLTSVYDGVAPELARTILDGLGRFAKRYPGQSPKVEDFLARVREEMRDKEMAERLSATAHRVQQLMAKERLPQAISVVENYLAETTIVPLLEQPLRETKEGWSLLLEAAAEGLTSSTEPGELETAVIAYEWARKLTSKVDRLVVLQQKVNVVQLAHSRQKMSTRIEDTHALLKASQFEKVLTKLNGASTDGLSSRDVDMYHYLRGSANYHLGDWQAAADGFRQVSRRDLEDIDLLHGMALVQAGQKSAGVAVLANLPEEARNETVNRLLGQYFTAQKDYPEAVIYFASVHRPTPEDSTAHFESRREMGLQFYRDDSYAKAAEQLELACQLLETQLPQRRTPDVYLHLGNSYYRMDDQERAKKVFQDLSNSGLSPLERKRCRDLFLYRGKIFLTQKRPDLAYQDLATYLDLEGELPTDVATVFGRLVATFGNYMPLDDIAYWNYVSTSMDYNYTLHVSKKETGAYRIQRREGGNKTSEETWWQQGIYLTKEVGGSVFKLPISLHPAESTVPLIEYVSRGMNCTSEIVEYDQTVEIPGRGSFEHCLKIRTQQRATAPGGQVRTTKHIFYLAPGVGEVKQEIYRDDVKVSEIVLAEFTRRDALLGN
jgi:tetratricopeptide (TPR) repeat protein